MTLSSPKADQYAVQVLTSYLDSRTLIWAPVWEQSLMLGVEPGVRVGGTGLNSEVSFMIINMKRFQSKHVRRHRREACFDEERGE